MREKKNKLPIAFASTLTSISNAFPALASGIKDVSITDEKFKSMTVTEVPGLIVGAIVWGLRIIGVIVFMVGIYRMVVAKKSGEADDINGAMVKIVIGAIFIGFPTILKALHIIA